MTLMEFIEDCATTMDGPIGDLAKDAMNDGNFPTAKSESEILEYMNFQTIKGGTNDIFKEFLSEYENLG